MTPPRIGFRVLASEDSGDRALWLTLWNAWPRREVFAHPAYVELFARPSAVRSRAAVYSDERVTVIYPFLLRDLAPESWCPPSFAPATDITTAYGYGGPFMFGDEKDCPFWHHFNDWASDQGVVSEFIRRSLFTGELLTYPGSTEERMSNIVRPLDRSLADIWMDFEHKVRKNVQKAQRAGVEIQFDSTGQRCDEFMRIYSDTMVRREARQSYNFGRDFFAKLQSGLSGHYTYVHAVADGAVISTELVLVSAQRVYSFLGGTDSSKYDLRPNDLLKFEIIRWAHGLGKECFVLGGGYGADDGIFRYKRSFAPTGTTAFSVGYRVLRAQAYDGLVAARLAGLRKNVSDVAASGYFPAYRAPSDGL